MWALLAVVADRDLRHGALGYGLLNGCIGLGAVIGAILLPRIRARFTGQQIVIGASLVFAVTLLVLAFVHRTALVVAVLLAAGMAWTSTTSTFNIAVQRSVPAWVQARALGTYQMVFQGGLALGSVVWGAVAERLGTPVALAIAAVTLLAGLPAARRIDIMRDVDADHSPIDVSLARAAPAVVIELAPEEGPVLISIEYHINLAEVDAFRAAIDELRHIRLRDGAVRWGLFKDPVEAGRYMETFLVESWVEYLRQRERMTVDDLRVRDRVYAFQRGETPPPISRMVYEPTRRPR